MARKLDKLKNSNNFTENIPTILRAELKIVQICLVFHFVILLFYS